MLDKFLFPRGSDRQKIMERYSPRSDGLAAVYARNHPPESDKKQRREIANKNERRRMQSINAGFHALKALIPHHDGEKLSKAAILQQTGEYIQSLEEEKSKLIAQNAQYKRLLLESEREREKDQLFNDSPPPKRKKRDTESSDEGISMGSSPDSSEDGIEELQRAMVELRSQLDKERWLRMVLEKRFGSQLYTDKLSDVSNAYVQTDLNKMTDYDELKSDDGSMKDDYPSYHTTSMSRKNLETMMEAIQHLEGRLVFEDDRQYEDRVPNTTIQIRTSSHPHHSEESEKDSSDQDDTKSESSDQCPTIHYTHRIHRHRLQNQYTQDNGKLVPQLSVHSEKYPCLQTIPNQFYTPTSVIVHNS
ncbi:hypothetical protein SNE40_016507 [Patella caerulea]|uniref:BHLH domain-containing protein n=1 Tax=Patella caerulea TaxID=87958 RepID=A0AAN8JBM6_PATCE